MSTELAGKVAVVTGTAHGIGSAIAAALRADGADVYGADLHGSGEETVDLTDSAAVTEFFAGSAASTSWSTTLAGYAVRSATRSRKCPTRTGTRS